MFLQYFDALTKADNIKLFYHNGNEEAKKDIFRIAFNYFLDTEHRNSFDLFEK